MSSRMVAVAAGLSVGVTVGYIVYRHLTASKGEQCETGVCETTVPVDLYRNLLRCTPDFLVQVYQQSGAQVKLVESGACGDQSGVCLQLQGSEQQILLARCILDGLVQDSKPVSEVLEVPHTSVGRIIGRGGEHVKKITRTTGASVSCRSEEGPEGKGHVSLSGTRREVDKAKELVMEKVMEDTMVRARISQSSAQRHRRGPLGNRKPESDAPPPCLNNNGPLSTIEDPEGPPSTETKGLDLFQKIETLKISNADCQEEDSIPTDSPQSYSDMSKFEIPSPDLSFQPDKHFEVYVSAVENPNHFWIQILGVRSLQLDQLTADMATFYSSDTTKQRVEALVVGDIVAAPYKDHGTWNRARVLGVLASGLVDLYYVDYGDNSELPRDALRPMRSDFLSLPFQAIECSLAGVKPQGDVWTEDALVAFETLTHCALWRPLQARLCSYSHCEATSWPSVRLYDASQEKSLDVGEELIRLGHATASLEPLNGLQKMLDDVMGASSELSLSCISLSEAASISGSIDDVLEDQLL